MNDIKSKEVEIRVRRNTGDTCAALLKEIESSCPENIDGLATEIKFDMAATDHEIAVFLVTYTKYPF